MNETIEILSQGAVTKIGLLKHSKKKYIISSMLAGAFIGVGVLTSFGAAAALDAVDSPFTKITMSFAFCIALTLVVFTGTELFTGNNMVMTIGKLNKKVSTGQVLSVWFNSWLGNLLGAIILSIIFVSTGLVKGPIQDYYSAVALAKVSMSPIELVSRGILCNLLVCLAILGCNRTQSDSAKIGIIMLCIYAFMTSGFEHSVANMTVFAIAIISK